jgi:MFS family permease
MRASTLPVYYGWFVLAASAVSELLAQGATSYSAGLFVLPLQAEYHLSRADANSAILILFLGVLFGAPLVGKWLDRYPIRLLVSLGAIMFSGALALVATTSSLWVMVLALLVPGAIGFAAIGPLTTSTLAARWFWKRRGLALGIAAISTSAGGLVVVPLLSQAIRAYGWRTGLLWEAVVIAAIIIALALLVLRGNPVDAGLSEHPENRGRISERKIIPRWTDILTRRAFWIPSLALATISGTCQAIVVTLVPYGVQLGVSPTHAALFISAFALSAGITKILAGVLADRIEHRMLIVAATLFMMLSQLLLLLVPTYGALLVSACLAGASLGCAMPVAAGMVAAGFGSAAFGAALGWTYALVAAFAIAATRFIGFVYDSSHGYMPAFATFLALSSGMFLATLLLAPRKAA